MHTGAHRKSRFAALTFSFVILLLKGAAPTPSFAKGPNLDDYPSLYKLLDDTDRAPSKRTIYRLSIKRAHSAQAVVGMDEVAYREDRLDALKNGHVREYLEESDHIGKVIIGPDREIWLIDGNHLARALNNLGLPDLLVRVHENWSSLTPSTFWKRMVQNGYVWDENGAGNKVEIPGGLANHVDELKDDVFRSFAWRVKKAGGFEKAGVFFAEFMWGRFFRHYFTRAEAIGASPEILNEALALAHSHRAAEARLPGFIPVRSPRFCEAALRKQKS